ncbi:MAG: MAPEG family protein [Gloeocapsa sp. DLM2.Bin57]|nr:MAG: MAPEG family protein [Gloeocapsa sp. DLM2.Bin57]
MLIEPTVITVLTLLVYFVITLNVGRARFKYDVKPPAMTGDPNFERALRVQQNTLEQIIFFLPLLWIFSYYISATWGFILGIIWVVGRILYAWGYYQAAEKRGPGFGISSLASLGLLGGAIIGLILSVRQYL